MEGNYFLNIKIKLNDIKNNDDLINKESDKNLKKKLEIYLNSLFNENNLNLDYEWDINSKFMKNDNIDKLSDEYIKSWEEKINNEYWYKNKFEWDKEIENLNKINFKNLNFKPNQKAIINAVMNKKDVFACMPTGYGKSLIFQMVSLIEKNPIVVIYPLLSLIEDQYQIMQFYKIKAFKYCHKAKLNVLIKKCKNEGIDLILATPEKLFKSDSLKLFGSINISKVFIDESHCIYQWGKDFRSDYLNIKYIREKYPEIPLIGLTATATPNIRRYIIQNLKMKDPELFQSSFNRPNLFLEVKNKDNISDTIKTIHNDVINNFYMKSGIIYVTSIKNSEKLSKDLNKLMHSYNSSFDHYYQPYHSKITDSNKLKIFNDWKDDKVFVIIATAAFGMGINKIDVRFIFHYNMPFNLENYYQEIGRSGRDGLPSFCKLYFSLKDRNTINYWIDGNSTDLQNLYNVILFCENKLVCRKKLILKHLGEEFGNCNFCDNCYYINKLIKINKSENIFENINLKGLFLNIMNFMKNKNNKKETIKKLLSALLKDKNIKKDLNYYSNGEKILLLYIMLSKKLIYEKKTGGRFKVYYIHSYKNKKIKDDIFYKVLKNDIENYTFNEIKYDNMKVNTNKKFNVSNINYLNNNLVKIRNEFFIYVKNIISKEEFDKNIHFEILFPLEMIQKIINFLPLNINELYKIINLEHEFNYKILDVIKNFIKINNISNEEINNYRNINDKNVWKENRFLSNVNYFKNNNSENETSMDEDKVRNKKIIDDIYDAEED